MVFHGANLSKLLRFAMHYTRMKVFWYRFFSVLRFALMAVVIMALLDQLANFALPAYITWPFAGMLGITFGIYHVFLGFRSVGRQPFLMRILIQMVILQAIIMWAVVKLDFVSAALGKRILGDYVVDDLFSPEFVPLYYKTHIFMFIFLFFYEIETILGRNFLVNYLIGKYDHPRKEHRIFMFLDLKGSTALAETLGDDRYYRLLNDCYSLLSKPIIRTRAEVLKYVGDEVILSWTYQKGLEFNNCVELFYTFQDALDANDAVFMRRYGAVPRFKAGVHDGEVIAAYLGEIRKQLDFSGDVMNTTARIAGACNEYEAEVLISEKLYSALPLPIYKHTAIGELELKGKAIKIEVVKLTGRKK